MSRRWVWATAGFAFAALGPGCIVPSTLGLPCEVHPHCDANQHCGPADVCIQGPPPGPMGDDDTGTTSSSTSTAATDSGQFTEESTAAAPSETGGTGQSTSSSTSTGPACGRAIGKCDKVDVLFVVDNSESMDDEIAVLLPAFTDFDGLIGNALDGVCDYHIGVTTTETAPNFQPTQCQVRGALSRSGALAGGDPCFSDPDHPPWVTSDDSLSSLGCFLTVGASYDDDEKQIDTMLAAIGPELAAPGACNEGFLRDDAPLIVLLVTDEDDDDDVGQPNESDNRTGSAGGPSDWWEQLVALRRPENVGVVGVLSNQSEGCDWEASVPDDGTGAEFASRILTFMQRFSGAGLSTHIATANICGTATELMAQIDQIVAVADAVCADATFE